MLVEIAKPIAMVLSILSLYAVFHTAFLVPGRTIEDRLWDVIALLALSACITCASGLIFREDEREQKDKDQHNIISPPHMPGQEPNQTLARTSIDRMLDRLALQPGLSATLPVRLFLWASAGMALLFFASWYLETYCIFYRDVRF